MSKKIKDLIDMINSGDPALVASAWAEVDSMVPKPCCKDPATCAKRRNEEYDDEFRRRHGLPRKK